MTDAREYVIVTMNEPDGEGNGWIECSADAEGCVWFSMFDGEHVDSFDTAEEAERFLRVYNTAQS